MRWSSIIPMLCKKEYIILGPTNLNPNFFKSLLSLIESSVSAGTSDMSCHSFIIGSPSTYDQRKSAKLPYVCCIS